MIDDLHLLSILISLLSMSVLLELNVESLDLFTNYAKSKRMLFAIYSWNFGLCKCFMIHLARLALHFLLKCRWHMLRMSYLLCVQQFALFGSTIISTSNGHINIKYIFQRILIYTKLFKYLLSIFK